MAHQSSKSRRLHPFWTLCVVLVGLLLLGAAVSMFVLASGPLVVLFLWLAVGLGAVMLVGAVAQGILRAVRKRSRKGQGGTGE